MDVFGSLLGVDVIMHPRLLLHSDACPMSVAVALPVLPVLLGRAIRGSTF